MTHSPQDFHEVFEREIARLGLDVMDLPGLALESGAEGELLAHVRSLAPGASWHDVFPDLPADFVPGDPDSWVTPFVPLGPFDYAAPPGSPAIWVQWGQDESATDLEALVAAGRVAGFRIYGAGPTATGDTDFDASNAYIVLERAVPVDDVFAFVHWLEQQPGVEAAHVPRVGDERYTDEGLGGHLT